MSDSCNLFGSLKCENLEFFYVPFSSLDEIYEHNFLFEN